MAAPDMGHVTPHKLRDRAARRLRDEIVTCILRPSEVLKDVELAQRLEISTTPVGEALSQLALERRDYAAANEALLAAIDGFVAVIETLPEDLVVTQEPPLHEPLR